MAKSETVSEFVIENPFETDSNLAEYLCKLKELRADGESKIIALNNEIRDLKLNRQVDDATKKSIIEDSKKQKEIAKGVMETKAEAVKSIVDEAVAYAKDVGESFYRKVSLYEEEKLEKAKAVYAEAALKEKEDHAARLADLGTIPSDHGQLSRDDVIEQKAKVKAENLLYKSRMSEARSELVQVQEATKDSKYYAFLDKYNYIQKVRNGKHSFGESIEYNMNHYKYSFVAKDYLLRNALYFIIIIFFVACIVLSNGNLISQANILGILSQSSVKLFYSLGVAGLILITGTDLSIGRMTGLGASTTCLFLSSYVYTSNFGFIINTADQSLTSRVLLALSFSILFCVFFSVIAGFFTAKFKMHPFITTLATQLLIYGISMVFYSETSSFTMNLAFKRTIAGTSNINIIVAAIVATMIVWFIWNKTKFGKNMYAVGGNSEAAAVSGISVFWVTMGIFIMAGVLYGFGGFFEGVRVGSANPNAGFGTELDAIAACVVGGISFNGGIGKIRGAVVGTLIFTGMTYCLTNLGYDVNIQFIFKGVIIMAAVCLDSLKYLKKN